MDFYGCHGFVVGMKGTVPCITHADTRHPKGYWHAFPVSFDLFDSQQTKKRTILLNKYNIIFDLLC